MGVKKSKLSDEAEKLLIAASLAYNLQIPHMSFLTSQYIFAFLIKRCLLAWYQTEKSQPNLNQRIQHSPFLLTQFVTSPKPADDQKYILQRLLLLKIAPGAG